MKMKFLSNKHQQLFASAVEKKNESNTALMAAIYLLTGDSKLWNLAEGYVRKNRIEFEDMKLNAIHTKGYTLFCAAKDMYFGSRNLAISDLTDRGIVSSKLFEVICQGMAIRRFGLEEEAE